jgi:hypothetical protein
MGDTTTLQLTIYKAPKRRHKKILEIINAHDLELDWSTRGPHDELTIGESAYTSNLAHPGEADEISTELIDVAPDCGFIVWDDPAYEFLGGLCMYTPELGEFGAQCDADGNPQLTGEMVIKLIDELAAARPETTIADVKAAVDKATGKPWFEAMRA